MKAILNEIMIQSNLSKIFRMIYENLTIKSLIIYSILFIIPIIYFANKKLNESKDILDYDKDIQERHISKKEIHEPSKKTKDKKENKSKSKILRKMIDFCICKMKKQKYPNQLQLDILLREEDGFQIKEEYKKEQILYNISQNNKISSKKEDNYVKKSMKEIKDNNINRIIETDIISQNKENNKKDIINSEEKEKIKIHISENKNEDGINKQINEKEEIKDNKQTQEGKDLKLIKGKGQNKKMNKPIENELNESIRQNIQSIQSQEINLNNQKLQIQKQSTFEYKKQNIEKGINKIIENMKYEIEQIKLKNQKMEYKIEEGKLKNQKMEYDMVILMIKTLNSDINENINLETFIQMKNEIISNIYKMSYIFRFLNNIRLILISRKYINQIIKYEVDNNKKLKISKTLFLNDIAGFKYKHDEKKIKLYISKFIVQIGDNILPQNQYNLTLDFLFFLKKFFNDSVHFVKIIKDITINEKFSSIFSSENKNYNAEDNKNSKHEDNKIVFNNRDNNSINISNIQYEKKNKDSDKILKNIENLKEINNIKIFQQYEVLNSLDTEVSNDIQEAHAEENQIRYLQKKMNGFNNLKSNQIHSISIINNELFLDNNINIIKDNSKQFYESNIQILKQGDIDHSLDKIIKIKEQIKDIVNTIKSDSLESQLTLELEKNSDLFDIDNINIDLNKNMNYSIHDLKNDSINNLKNIFINYFIEKEEKKSYYNSDYLLKKEKENINLEFTNIMNEIISAENLVNTFQKNSQFFNSNNNEDLKSIVSIINSIKADIIEIKGLLENMKNKIMNYYDILLLSIAFKIKIKQLHEKFLQDKNVLTFEELLKNWKNEFLDEHIKDLKKNYLIDENIMTISTQYKGKKINIEYLKTSKEYKKYIIDSELSQINAELMLSNIDALIQNRKIDIYGTDEDIDFSKLPFLSEE